MNDQISFLQMMEPRDTSFEDNEQEYREELKRESPTVYAARVASGIYQEA